MKKLQTWALGATVLLMALLSGCTTQLETRTTHLTSGTWQFQSLSNPDLDSDTRDFFNALLSLADFNYMEDGTYLLTFADSTLDNANGTWRFNNDATQLILDEGTDDETINTIIDLSEQLLVFSYMDSLGTNELTYIQ